MLHNLRSDKGLLCDPVLALNRDGTKASPSATKTANANTFVSENGPNSSSISKYSI